MKVKELFEKPINRDIQGVIKVGQSDEIYIHQELEEYVVTNELKKHFNTFFSKYTEGISHSTDKIGVWISGFFGCGKSHFLKILSYLLENKKIGEKRAIDFFKDGSKIDDSFLIANMDRAASEADNTDIALFNIDSKNSTGTGEERDPIVNVFLKVFNEMQGYCGSDPHIADLERRLEEQGKLEDFKNIFESKDGSAWNESRYGVSFIQDSIIAAISEIGLMSQDAARNWCEKITAPFEISNVDFAMLVKRYLDRKGKNRRLIFLVDEMGQFIGQDSRLMLNLQTLVEDLGTHCQGRVWVIVTSQEDIDAITKNMAARSNDFSKIQGRFDTRLSLSSVDVAEVIRKRILEKTAPAQKTLSLIYDKKAIIIKNLIVFTNTAQKKLYENEHNFVKDYPFVPYQFDLLGNVLTAVREHGSSGKHLAQGERSMIALFKESALRLSESEIGPLVPFNLFYDALDQFLDSSHRRVIQSALGNGRINPGNKEDCLAVNVLKTLFLIKYVKEITASLDNITSLMCSSINEDRLELSENIKQALKILQQETLVSKNGEIYIFLTNEEQEVNREIDRQNVTAAEVLYSAAALIFDDIIGENKYKLIKFNGRYSYSYNQKVDDVVYNPRQNHPFTLQIITPDSGQQYDTSSLLFKSSQMPGVLVVLPERLNFMEELRRHLCIEKYLRSGSYRSLQKAEEIELLLQNENNDRKTAARALLEDSLREARLFVNGNEELTSAKDIKQKINGALDLVISSVYHKLALIDFPLGTENIRNLFTKGSQILIPGGGNPNRHAVDEMRAFIESNTQRHSKTSMRALRDRFMKEPYGFVEDDIEWLCARLFADGEISIYVSNALILIHEKSENELVNYFSRKQYEDSLTMEIRRKANDVQLRSAREIMKALFNDSAPDADEDTLFQNFKSKANKKLETLKGFSYNYRECPEYPGKEIVSTGIEILQILIPISSPLSFFSELLQKKDEILDFSEDYENVESFFSGKQCEIFAEAVKAVKSFKLNSYAIFDPKIAELAEEIGKTVCMPCPYKLIQNLPELTDKYNTAIAALCKQGIKPLLESLEVNKRRIFAKIEGKTYKEDFNASIVSRFENMENKVKACTEPSFLDNMEQEIARLNTDILNELARKDAEIITLSMTDTISIKDELKIRITKHISIKKLVSTPSWCIETEDDIETYLAQLRHGILAEMKADDIDIISVEF